MHGPPLLLDPASVLVPACQHCVNKQVQSVKKRQPRVRAAIREMTKSLKPVSQPHQTKASFKDTHMVLDINACPPPCHAQPQEHALPFKVIKKPTYHDTKPAPRDDDDFAVLDDYCY